MVRFYRRRTDFLRIVYPNYTVWSLCLLLTNFFSKYILQKLNLFDNYNIDFEDSLISLSILMIKKRKEGGKSEKV